MSSEYIVEGDTNEFLASFNIKNDAIDYAFEYFRTTEDDRRFNQVSVKDSNGKVIFTNFRTPTTFFYDGPMT